MENFTFFIPENVRYVLDTLTAHGYKAYIVGGCVRDALLGRVINDYDVATSALPEQTLKCFPTLPAIKTGIKHGTVTIVSGGENIEVTTFRVDGVYSDCRHPDLVSFTESAELDLSRRDFTINAMAYSPIYGLLDPFGGHCDLDKRLIKCVGEPEKRFSEDALRIMRALRFSSQLGFEIEPGTLEAIHRLRNMLGSIAVERIYAELVKLLCGVDAEAVLRLCPDVIGVFIPEILSAVGFEQRNPHHIYDVWEHTVRVVGGVRADKCLRLAALFHDLGKPLCMTIDESGVAHFHGHAAKGAEIADLALLRLKIDNETRKRVVRLVAAHDDYTDGSYIEVRRYAATYGLSFTRQLIELIEADTRAKAPICSVSLRLTALCTEALDELERTHACLSLSELAVNGNDLIAAGIEGRKIGSTLEFLFNEVTECRIANEKEALMQKIKSMNENNGE